MRGVDLVLSDDYAEVYEAEVYDSSEQALAYVAHAIPSIDELRGEFCAEFRRAAPGCELSAIPMLTRVLLVRDDAGAEAVYRRRKLYGKARVDMEHVHAGGVGLVEHVRGACLLAARKMAATIAIMAHAGSPFVLSTGGAASIRFTGGPLNWPGFSYTRRPRVAVEFNRDSLILILASYYVLIPAGATVIEPDAESTP
jgi:hypothetical protein